MINLTDSNLSYLLIKPEVDGSTILENHNNCERACSVLYSKDYLVVPIKEFYQGKYTNCFLGISNNVDNDDIRTEILQILEFLDIESAYLKYNGQKDAVLINKKGEEIPMSFSMYESYEDSKVYIYDSVYFTFKKQKRYFTPTKKDHLKQEMIVEFFNNDRWIEKKIQNVDVEYDKMYQLLMKYNKLRIPM